MELIKIPVYQIRPNPDQPRKHFDLTALHDLRRSIRMVGQLEPIAVRRIPKEKLNGSGALFDLIDGERRWRASSMEGSDIHTLDAIVRDVDNDEQYLQSCAHNFGREGHTPYEELLMVRHLTHHLGLSQNSVATVLAKSITWVNHRAVAFDRLDGRVISKLKEGRIRITAAIRLSKLKPDDQVAQMHRYLDGGSVTDIAVAVRQATDRGEVQGGVRKSDLKDDRRYIETSVRLFSDRFKRLEVIGWDRIAAATRSIEPTERSVMINDLMRSGKQIVELMTALRLDDE